MRTMRLVAYFRPERNGQQAATWQEALEREVSRARRAGLSGREIVERAAQLLYRDDLRELGPLLDLGLFTWEAYLEDAELMVAWLLQQAPEPVPQAAESRRSA